MIIMRSDAVKKGMQTAPQRSLFNALGITEEELEKPLIGIVSSYNEIVPGHMNIDKIVDAVKMGVAMAGVRWYCDGTYRYEILSCNERSDL